MKYSFPITANMRSLLPSVEKVFSNIEGHFSDFTGGEKIKLTCQAPIMHFDVTTPIALNSDQLKLVHATLMPLLIEKFPNCDIEIGPPVMYHGAEFGDKPYEFNAAHKVAMAHGQELKRQAEREQSQDSAGYDVDDSGTRIDSDHNMYLRQDNAAMYGECAKCQEPLTASGTCPGGCTHSEAL